MPILTKHDKEVKEKELVLRIMPMPSDSNINGHIFGGWIMSQIDIAGSILAAKIAAGKVATIAVNSIQFKDPILVGDLISLYASIVRTGNTSITVSIDVYSQKRPFQNDSVKAVEAKLTYVAIDKQGNSRPLTSL
ncbi:acyl-CoA thioesterase YciA [Candidatus Kinetoplastibacterium blastocrithidii TCC012E]|uniref:Acyl-CoA thioesterase YciA n=1 Tax=Candidatus Kinetoplastidibacterium blastocrithidiae TCC012E TaxID=1208922 RepID=M1LAP6_9PROT|nr:acyl-CoA thioesterase [Candidatus Kinetoplastibacterium blastocrithidii]AFZ83462.1 acyl-CoA thioesterase YciA [Candidatus Kinetoplastibacterium blastocrithidii (ex Strigomonas culicis)]AGF49558.1 acyl-CoA thioesterase YciA [Candidatus Kinetoplastibacterium blastocrithidii TCC012E]